MDDKNLDISIKDLILILRKNLFWVIVSFLVILSAFVSVAYLSPEQYSTSLKIMIDKTDESTDFMFSSFPWYWDPTLLNNEVEILKTYRMSKLIVDNLPPETRDMLLEGEDLSEVEQEYYLVKFVQNMISIEPIPETDIIKINVYAYDPMAAFVVAQTLKTVYLEDNLSEKRRNIKKVRTFLEQQLLTFKMQLEDAEKKLQDYKQIKGAAYLGSESVERIKRMADFEARYYTTKTEYTIKTKNLELLASRLDEQRWEAFNKISSISTPLIDSLKTKIVSLEIELTSLEVQGYDRTHPKVASLEKQIAEVKGKLQDALSEYMGGDYGVDPVSIYQHDLETYMALQIEVEVLSLKMKELEKIVKSYEESMEKLPANQIEILRLTREMEVSEKIYLMLKEKYEETKIKEAGQKGDLRVIDGPNYPLRPFKPRRRLLVFIGIIAGGFFGFGVGLIKEYLDFRIKTPMDFEKIPDVKLLGVIPKAEKKLQSRELAEFEKKISSSDMINNFTLIRKNIQLMHPDQDKHRLLVSSTVSGAGKSTFAVNLGISFAKANYKVVILDCDLRKPVLHEFFNNKIENGIVDYLVDGNDISEYIISISEYDIDILTAGSINKHPIELFESKKFKKMLDELSKRYDLLIIDSAPILAVPDAAILGLLVDCIVLVESAGVTTRDQFLEAKKILESLQTCLSGVVLNKVTIGSKKYYYKYKTY